MSEDNIADQMVKDISDPERDRKEYRTLPAITAPMEVSKYVGRVQCLRCSLRR
jgi:hypothetical protein